MYHLLIKGKWLSWGKIPCPLGERNIADRIYLDFSQSYDVLSQKKQISGEDSAEDNSNY